MNKKIIFIILIVVVVIGSVGFLYYRGTIFSKEILKLEILSQDNVKMGDEIEYTVKYKNNGNFVLENPKLIFELPDNSLTEDSKIRFTQSLKDIYPGGEEFVKFKGRLLGKEGDLKVAKASLSYLPHNLSARYESNTTFTTKIISVPITLVFDLPSKVEKGKEINYSINYFSNIDYPLEHLSIKIDKLNGFDFKSADPSSLDGSEWKLDILNKAHGGKIKIKGAISADTGSHLNFNARLGMWQDGSFVIIKEANQDVEVIQPLLFLSQQINGSSNYTASPGENLKYEIFIRNIGLSPFDNLFVISRLDGLAFDFSTLSSNKGQAKPNDNLIVWDSRQIPELGHLLPQQEVRVGFSIKLKDSSSLNSLGQVIKNKVNVFDINEEFITRINSKLELSQKVYHSVIDGIENSGPVPPEVGKTTTYTVSWQVKNSFNDVKNIKVKAFLPQNVTLSDSIIPENQISNFSLDSNSREIVWSVGDLASGSLASLTLQIALTPSLSQKGKPADLISQATVSGEDQFTGVTTQSTSPAVNSNLPDDQANSGGGIVQ